MQNIRSPAAAAAFCLRWSSCKFSSAGYDSAVELNDIVHRRGTHQSLPLLLLLLPLLLLVLLPLSVCVCLHVIVFLLLLRSVCDGLHFTVYFPLRVQFLQQQQQHAGAYVAFCLRRSSFLCFFLSVGTILRLSVSTLFWFWHYK